MPKRSSLTLLRLYSGCGVSTSDFRMRSNYGGISILQRAKTSQPWFIFKENKMKSHQEVSYVKSKVNS